MSYDLIYTGEVRKQLKKLDEKQRRRIISTLERCRIRPHSFIKKLVSSPYFRLRVGEFRVIVDIRNNELVIMVLEIGHRRNIYK